ncbi:Rid family hydrolase [Segnochrobactrum spirostomi]|uniref:Pyrimidine utilization protein C n=1 Tax=Segnochrobactrum spirostomi TaxID=2608987 RepID=A0A6A7YBX0_9HYPH|nr:Rid family hydrolase [Segnochrobactrum spirostomi]MQT15481.1 pyrimidine utilization protein C [Segnochrobactrum spirostomi]
MAVDIITPPQAPPPLAPYSSATRANGLIFVSGTLAMAPDGAILGIGDAAEQTRVVLELIKAAVETGGGRLETVLFNHIFLKDLADYAAMNEVYRTFFPLHRPARYTIQTPLVKQEFLVEIATVAAVADPV